MGFIAYTLVKIFRGKFKDIHWLMYVVSALFLLMFAWDKLRAMGILP